MKSPPILLLGMGYISSLIFSAGWLETLDNTCVVVVYGPVEIVSFCLGLGLMAGYSRAVSNGTPWNSPRLFWTTSTLFNLALPAFVIFLGGGASLFDTISKRLSSLKEVFYLDYRPELALGALGGLELLIIVLWMPLAAILSFISLLDLPSRDQEIESAGASLRHPPSARS